MNLNEMYARISAEINRGTTLDSVIPAKVRAAVKWIESTHTFLYMDKFAQFELNPADAYPRTITLPTGWKSIKFIRLIRPGSTDFKYLRRIDPINQVSLEPTEDKLPDGYWLDGKKFAWLDSAPGETVTGEIAHIAHTPLQGVDEDTDLEILEHLEELVLATTIVKMGPVIRDDKMIARYKADRDDEFNSAIETDVEARRTNADEAMEYAWERR